MTKKKLKKAGFKRIVRNDGAIVLELKLSKKESLRTWGNSESGEVAGIQLYNRKKDVYYNTVDFL